MANKQISKFCEALENIDGIDILECKEEDIFSLMQPSLLNAFDKETTFDMRKIEQIELLQGQSSVGTTTEKDGKIYPFINLVVTVKDGYFDPKTQQFNIFKTIEVVRDSIFDVTFTPFTCSLEKHSAAKNGFYSGSDKELTKAWRAIMKEVFPAWESKFRSYLETIKTSKIESTNAEYNQELESLGLN